MEQWMWDELPVPVVMLQEVDSQVGGVALEQAGMVEVQHLDKRGMPQEAVYLGHHHENSGCQSYRREQSSHTSQATNNSALPCAW
jgi:hypothetical protein